MKQKVKIERKEIVKEKLFCHKTVFCRRTEKERNYFFNILLEQELFLSLSLIHSFR